MSLLSGKFNFSDEEIEEIYVDLRAGRSNNAIAHDFGCSGSYIRDINYGKYYKRENFDYPIKQNRYKKDRRGDSDEPSPFRILREV